MRKLPFIEKNKRRALVYGPRLIRMLSRGGLKERCCFMHVPKSGGSSVNEALHALAPFDRHIMTTPAIPTRRAMAVSLLGRDDENAIHEDGPNSAPLFAFREQMMLTGMAHDDILIHGHFLYSSKGHEAFPHYRWITMLRDPIERVISNFKDARRAGFFTGTMDEYIASGVARRHGQLNLRYFSETPEVPEGGEGHALAKALDNLGRFAVIGFLDRLDLFKAQFAEVFGVAPKIAHYNVGMKMKVDLTAEQRRALEAFCAPDYEIFEAARAARLPRSADTARPAAETPSTMAAPASQPIATSSAPTAARSAAAAEARVTETV